MTSNMIHIEEGKYTIQLQAFKKAEDLPSAMSDYLSQVAIVTQYSDYLTLTLMFQSEQTITGFQIENEAGEFIEAVEKHVDAESERRAEAFELKALPYELPVRVQYEVEHDGRQFSGDEPLRLVFEKDSLKKLEV